MTGIVGNLLSSGKQGNATLYAMLNPVWNLISGPVSLILIIYCLTRETQGYFYTFHSLVALKSFFELGLYLVIINTASHEWAKLELNVNGGISGDEHSKSRLISLGRFIFRWYSVVSFLFIVVVGFAGATADAFTLFEKFETKLEQYNGNLVRAAVELAKDWRTDKILRRLEALLIAADTKNLLVISGMGDVIEPDDGVIAIGSGGPYATAAAKALVEHSSLKAKDIAEKALKIAANICIYTNEQITSEEV